MSALHDKTPWNPSRKATARVKNPLPAPTVHDGCGGTVEIAHHNTVYGHEYSDWPWMYRCTTCDATVGMHPFTNIPLGILADKALRAIKTQCKQPFERLWKTGRMARSRAYEELAAHLGIDAAACHFGWFDAAQCVKARDWAVSQLKARSK